jgi:hypothetical protein
MEVFPEDDTQPDTATTLYDVGGFFLILMVSGIPLGSLVDYLWNLLVFSLAVAWLSRRDRSGASMRPGRKALYCLIVTALGLLIDLAYMEMTWDTDFLGRTHVWAPAMPIPQQWALIVVPMIMIGMVNYAVSRAFLDFEHKHSIFVGVAMGVFTAPWLLPIVPWAAGWVPLP